MLSKVKTYFILFLTLALCVITAACGKPDEYTSSGVPIVSGSPDFSECVKYPDWKGVELTSSFPAPTEEEIQQYARKSKSTATTSDPSVEAQKGDKVIIDYHGEIAGQSFNGGDGSGVEVTLGDNSYIADFESAIGGMHPGESKTFEVTIPENYAKALAGQKATFTITLNSITRPETVTDEDLKKAEAELKESRRSDEIIQLSDDAWNYMFENAKWKKMPRKYLSKFLKQYDEDILKSFKSVDQYLEEKKLDKDDYEKAKNKLAENQAKAYILTMALKEDMGIDEDSKEFKKAVDDMVKYQDMNKEEMEEAYGEGSLNEYILQQIESRKIAENAKITNKK